MYSRIAIAIWALLAFNACSQEEWRCVEDGKSLYSMSISGGIGSADKGCSCAQIREFELRVFGSVDEGALKSDFGC